MNESIKDSFDGLGNLAVDGAELLKQTWTQTIADLINSTFGLSVSPENVILILLAISFLFFMLKFRWVLDFVNRYGTVIILIAVGYLIAVSLGVV